MDDLIEDILHLVKVEDEIQLADVFESPIQRLDKHLDQVQDPKLAFGSINHKHKVKSSVMSVNDSRIVF